jgi:hypothetical protein
VTRRLARTRRCTVAAVFVLVVLGATAVPGGASTLASSRRRPAPHGATARITTPHGRHRDLFGSRTRFAVGLPHQAACPGPSSAGFHVYSYLVPAGTDVTSVVFTTHPSAGYGLVDARTKQYYGSVDTRRHTGGIRSRPTFAWAPILGVNGSLTLSSLLHSGSSGQWDAGLACVDSTGHVTSFWTVHLLFVASHRDPHGFKWCVVPGPPTQAPEVPYALALPLTGVVVAGGFVGFRRRRTRRSREALHPWSG